MALGVLNVLDAATVSQKFPQRRLAFHIGPAAQIVAVEHQKIESKCAGSLVVDPTMQRVEVRNPVRPDPDNLSVKNCGALDMGRSIDDQRIALRPIRPVHRVEPHPAIPDMYLQAIAVVLQLVRPARSSWGLFGDDWLAGMDESSRRFRWPAARTTQYHAANIGLANRKKKVALETPFGWPLFTELSTLTLPSV